MLCFLLFLALGHTAAQDNFNIFIPESIQSNSNFEISIVTLKKFSDAKKLNIYFSPDISLIINKVELLTKNKRSQLSLHSEFLNDYSEQFQKVSIDLTDTTQFSDGSYFQLIINLKSNQTTSSNLKFFGEFINNDELIGNLINSKLYEIDETKYLYDISFNYYRNYFISGSALSLLPGSYFNIPLVYPVDKKLAVEFWMKIKNPASTFLEIINWGTNRVEYTIKINDNQLLIINSLREEILQNNSFFVSQNVWYHFTIIFDKENSEIVFSFDEAEIARVKSFNDIDFENMVLHFQNENPKGEINLDQLRVINLEDGTSGISRNKNYLDYSDDHSIILLQLHFNEAEINDLLAKKVISFEKIRFVKSDAPLFPKSPEIKVTFTEKFYEIEWWGGSYKDALRYILEKASGDNEFIQIGELAADNNERKTYSLITEKIDQDEIVYFRIKQVNKDGAVIYSTVCKVGQGILEDVIIGQNFPNPFNPNTLIEFELIQDTDVEVKVYNLAGKEISVLHKGFLSKGLHQFEFDGSGLSSGLYFYQITTSLTSQTRKMILAK